MAEHELILINNNAQWLEQTESLLNFVDTQPVRTMACDDWKEAIVEKDTDALLLGPCKSGDNQQKLYSEIRGIFPRLPILLYVSPGEITQLNLEGDPAAYPIVEPLTHRELTNALRHVAANRVSEKRGFETRSASSFRSLVGNSTGIRRVRSLVHKVADTNSNVLILGESGTGKEVVARNLHYYSARRSGPFVPVNCGAIPPELLESELFGHEKGAFTGAITARKGRFELAEGGTLFLDEIGEMSLTMQVKLLRVLQERTFERVGGTKVIRCDVRILAATHRDLELAMTKGVFREDLYFRLNVFPIELPPLRERSDDLPILIGDLVTKLSSTKNIKLRLNDAALESLSHYHWPGNVRELANLLERLAILYPDRTIDFADLPEKYQIRGSTSIASRSDLDDDDGGFPVGRLPQEGIDLKGHIQDLEYMLIKQALESSAGVVAHAAELLKMRRTTLVEKLRKYDISVERGRRHFDD